MEVFPHFDAKIYRVLRFEMGLTNHHMCGIRGYVRFGDVRFGRFGDVRFELSHYERLL